MTSVIGEVSEKTVKINQKPLITQISKKRLHRFFCLKSNLCNLIFNLCNHRTGFTLVEMLVVLAIISMFLGISTPFVAGFGKGLRLRASAREISGVLRIARSNAVTFRKDFSVVFNTQKGEYQILDSDGGPFDKVYRLPRSISLRRGDDSDPVTFPEDRITFKPTGSIEGPGGSITITDSRGLSREVVVIGPTGKINIK